MHYYAYTKYCTWAGYQDVDTKTVHILSDCFILWSCVSYMPIQDLVQKICSRYCPNIYVRIKITLLVKIETLD